MEEKIVAENQTQTEEKSKLYMLIEMKDNIANSIQNIENVITQQKKLIEIVEQSDSSEEFKDFISETNTQLETFAKQIETLKQKSEMLEAIIKKCIDNVDYDNFLTFVFEALGIQK